MSEALASLAAANIAFVGTHFALSHPLRGGLVKALGEKGFMGLYTIVAFACLGWVIMAFRTVGPGGESAWNGQSELAWVIGSIITIVAIAMVIGANRGNPAMPGTEVAAVARAKAQGVFAITRHPMMWGIALWALGHVIVAPNARTTMTAGAMAFLALAGSHLQDRKKEALMGDAWKGWEAQTSFIPRLGALPGVGAGLWLIALAAWLIACWLHVWLAYVPAGVWRWVG